MLLEESSYHFDLQSCIKVGAKTRVVFSDLGNVSSRVVSRPRDFNRGSQRICPQNFRLPSQEHPISSRGHTINDMKFLGFFPLSAFGNWFIL